MKGKAFPLFSPWRFARNQCCRRSLDALCDTVSAGGRCGSSVPAGGDAPGPTPPLARSHFQLPGPVCRESTAVLIGDTRGDP